MTDKDLRERIILYLRRHDSGPIDVLTIEEIDKGLPESEKIPLAEIKECLAQLITEELVELYSVLGYSLTLKGIELAQEIKDRIRQDGTENVTRIEFRRKN